MEDKIDNLLNKELEFVNAMLAYVAKNGTETFNVSQIQEMFGFDPITFRSMRDQMNQCCVHNPHAPGVYIVIVRECVALRNHFVSLQIHERHTALLTENNEVHRAHMKSESKLIWLTRCILCLTIVLALLTAGLFLRDVFPALRNIPSKVKTIDSDTQSYKSKPQKDIIKPNNDIIKHVE